LRGYSDWRMLFRDGPGAPRSVLWTITGKKGRYVGDSGLILPGRHVAGNPAAHLPVTQSRCPPSLTTVPDHGASGPHQTGVSRHEPTRKATSVSATRTKRWAPAAARVRVSGLSYASRSGLAHNSVEKWSEGLHEES